jgi:hemoglobin
MFDRIGGEPKLLAIVDEFVDQMVDDVMIGFFFRDVNRARLKLLEYQHAAEFLGAPVHYEGRPLRQAHAPHRIMGGQFSRRKTLLRKILLQHQVPQDIVDAWLAQVESLRDQVTTEPDGQCND